MTAERVVDMPVNDREPNPVKKTYSPIHRRMLEAISDVDEEGVPKIRYIEDLAESVFFVSERNITFGRIKGNVSTSKAAVARRLDALIAGEEVHPDFQNDIEEILARPQFAGDILKLRSVLARDLEHRFLKKHKQQKENDRFPEAREPRIIESIKPVEIVIKAIPVEQRELRPRDSQILKVLFKLKPGYSGFAFNGRDEILKAAFDDRIGDEKDYIQIRMGLQQDYNKAIDGITARLRYVKEGEESIPESVKEFVESIKNDPIFAHLSIEQMIEIVKRAPGYQELVIFKEGEEVQEVLAEGDPAFEELMIPTFDIEPKMENIGLMMLEVDPEVREYRYPTLYHALKAIKKDPNSYDWVEADNRLEKFISLVVDTEELQGNDLPQELRGIRKIQDSLLYSSYSAEDLEQILRREISAEELLEELEAINSELKLEEKVEAKFSLVEKYALIKLITTLPPKTLRLLKIDLDRNTKKELDAVLSRIARRNPGIEPAFLQSVGTLRRKLERFFDNPENFERKVKDGNIAKILTLLKGIDNKTLREELLRLVITQP